MPRPIRKTLTPITLDVGYISTTESITTPWALQLDGILTFDTPQHVSVTTTSDESGETFTVVGTDRFGVAMTEALAGPAIGTVVGVKNFASITSITGTADATGVTAGIDGLCEGAWIPLNIRTREFSVGIGVNITGVMTYGVQHTFDDVFAADFNENSANPLDHDTLTSQTVNNDGNYTNPPNAMRFQITAHTAGSLIGTINQTH